MTTRTTSRQRIGGVTKKRDRPESATDGPSVEWRNLAGLSPAQCASCVLRRDNDYKNPPALPFSLNWRDSASVNVHSQGDEGLMAAAVLALHNPVR